MIINKLIKARPLQALNGKLMSANVNKASRWGVHNMT